MACGLSSSRKRVARGAAWLWTSRSAFDFRVRPRAACRGTERLLSRAAQVPLVAAGGALAAALVSLLRHVAAAAGGCALRYDIVYPMLPEALSALALLVQHNASSRKLLLVRQPMHSSA